MYHQNCSGFLQLPAKSIITLFRSTQNKQNSIALSSWWVGVAHISSSVWFKVPGVFKKLHLKMNLHDSWCYLPPTFLQSQMKNLKIWYFEKGNMKRLMKSVEKSWRSIGLPSFLWSLGGMWSPSRSGRNPWSRGTFASGTVDK